MADDNGAVFVSYTEDRESREMAAQIERSLQARGIQFIHTRRDLGYGESISDFRERIGRGTCVIVLISHQVEALKISTNATASMSHSQIRDSSEGILSPAPCQHADGSRGTARLRSGPAPARPLRGESYSGS